MTNLIKNWCWQSYSNGTPTCFSGAGFTLDNFCVGRCRTCSTTIDSDFVLIAGLTYDTKIDVCGKCAICFGYMIRAVEADSIELVAEFYDCDADLIETKVCSIEDRVGPSFSRQCARFTVPCDAATVVLSLRFDGIVTACTYYAPTAWYC